MYPDLLEVFGVTLYGTEFERVLWGVLFGMMTWGFVSSIRIISRGRKAEGVIQGLIVTAILIWSGIQFYSTFSGNYVPVFSEPLVVHSYAFCALIGVILGTITAMKMGGRRGIDGVEIAKLCLLLIVLGFLGARLGHVIVDWEPYWNACFHPELEGMAEPHCLRVLNFAEGGLTFYGGVIVGMVVIGWYLMRRHRRGQSVMILEHLDALAGALAISHAFGRIGCLCAGCCWGAITTGKIGIQYGADSFAFAELVRKPEFHDVMMTTGKTPLLHATQIYESAGEFIIYGILWAMLMRGAKPGKMAGTWLMVYGCLRFVIEIMRDDAERGYYFEKTLDSVNEFLHVVPGHSTILSTSQGIGIVMFLLGAIVFSISSLCNKKSVVRVEPEGETAQKAASIEPEGEIAQQIASIEPEAK